MGLEIKFVNKMAPDYLSPEDRRRISGQTAYDAHLEKKRTVLRQALKREYILKTYNMKKAPDYQVFDSAMMRYQAALTSEGQWSSRLGGTSPSGPSSRSSPFTSSASGNMMRGGNRSGSTGGARCRTTSPGGGGSTTSIPTGGSETSETSSVQCRVIVTIALLESSC